MKGQSVKYILFFYFGFLMLLVSCKGQNKTQEPHGSYSDQKIHTSNHETEFSDAIFIIFQDKKNHFWFGSDDKGVYHYNGDSVIHYSIKDGLSSNRIREIQEDNFGNIYLTTIAGVNKFDGLQFTTLPIASSKEWKLEPNDLWFKGEPGKNGPYRYDGDSLYDLEFPKHYMEDSFYTQIPNPSYSPYEVYAIYKDDENNIWLGTSNFGLCRFNGKSLSWLYEDHLTNMKRTGGSFGIRSVLKDNDGKFWICNTQYSYNINPVQTEKGLISYERENGIDNIAAPNGDNFVYFMCAAKGIHGDIWLATHDMGVWQYSGETLTHYPVDFTLYSIYIDNQNTIWLGTHEAGTYKFNGVSFEKFVP